MSFTNSIDNNNHDSNLYDSNFNLKIKPVKMDLSSDKTNTHSDKDLIILTQAMASLNETSNLYTKHANNNISYNHSGNDYDYTLEDGVPVLLDRAAKLSNTYNNANNTNTNDFNLNTADHNDNDLRSIHNGDNHHSQSSRPNMIDIIAEETCAVELDRSGPHLLVVEDYTILAQLGFYHSTADTMASASATNLALANYYNIQAQRAEEAESGDAKVREAMTRFAYLTTALSAVVQLVSNLFMTIISIPFALYNKEASGLPMLFALRSGIDLSAFFIGLVGTFSPNTGGALYENLLIMLKNEEEAPALESNNNHNTNHMNGYGHGHDSDNDSEIHSPLNDDNNNNHNNNNHNHENRSGQSTPVESIY